MTEAILFLGMRLEYWTLLISGLAIFIALLKDFILPLIFKPKLKFFYEERPPFKRMDVGLIIDKETNKDGKKPLGTFVRFKVKNTGRATAKNCRAQVFCVKKDNEFYGDYQGFPLKWASRPESEIGPIRGERLDIGRGEAEFVDLISSNSFSCDMYLQKYHRIHIGIPDVIPTGQYKIEVLFSGANFKPSLLTFEVKKERSQDWHKLKVKLLGVKKLK